MEITPLGDSALLVRVCDSVATHPRETLEQVIATMERIDAAKLPGVVELAPAYTAIGIYYDPSRVVAEGVRVDSVFEWLAAQIQALGRAAEGPDVMTHGKVVEIPVCYGGEFGPDLAEVARYTGLAPEEVVRRHCEAETCVHFLGFTPGFPYLSGLPPELAVPRRAVPRKDTPAGSVGIGGSQTGIYPMRSPGGWNLIGRTPLRLFRVNDDPPTVLRPGDRVHFRPIAPEEFHAWRE